MCRSAWTPISKWQDHQSLPLKVDLVLSDQLRTYVLETGGGYYRFPFGKPIAINAEAMANTAFNH
jgi:hypothetical protein